MEFELIRHRQTETDRQTHTHTPSPFDAVSRLF